MIFTKITIEPAKGGTIYDFERPDADGKPMHHMVKVQEEVGDPKHMFARVYASIERQIVHGS